MSSKNLSNNATTKSSGNSGSTESGSASSNQSSSLIAQPVAKYKLVFLGDQGVGT